MKLVFIHGPAAAGKLTVARAVARRTGFRLFHNHLAVDAVAAVFEFGSEPFVALREHIWLSVFREAARRDVSLIFTFAPERTVRPAFIQETIDAVRGAGGEILFVELTCAPDELERRIESAERAQFGKLRSRALFRELERNGAFDFPALPSSGLAIDTAVTPPEQAAAQICRFFALE